MKRKRIVTITEIFCDVCGAKCGNHATHTDSLGNEQHACLEYNEEYGKQCAAVLEERVHAIAIAKRNEP